MYLSCPFCGDRDIEEFRFRQLVPEASASSAIARVYERENRLNDSVEYWQHVHGCRAWLVVRRDPMSAAVANVQLLGAGQ